MAIGLTPKYIEDLPLNNLTSQEFLVIATEVAKRLNWDITYLSPTGIIAFTNNGTFSWNGQISIRIEMENGQANLKSESAGSDMIDMGRNKKNITRFIDLFLEIKPQLLSEDIAAKYEQLQITTVTLEEDRKIIDEKSKSINFKDVVSIFIPVQGYFITPLLINLNILYFLAMIASGVSIILPDTESLMTWGANFKPITVGGQWWRLLSACFVHVGLVHLIMNMFALAYIGVLLEPYLGKIRFISAYMITGIIGSLLSVYWNDFTVSAGASGAIFGMYGVFLAMLTTNLIEKNVRNSLFISIGIFVGYNLLMGLRLEVDNAAHIGGLLAGIIIGYLYIPSLKNPDKEVLKYIPAVLMLVMIIPSTFLIPTEIKDDMPIYEKNLQDFSEMEKMALQVQRHSSETKEDYLYEIKARGIYYWKDCIRVLEESQKLNIPEVYKDRNSRLIDYCELRIEVYELVYKSLEEETQQYEPAIKELNEKIKRILDEFGVTN